MLKRKFAGDYTGRKYRKAGKGKMGNKNILLAKMKSRLFRTLPEVKTADVVSLQLACNSTSTFTLCNALAQGPGRWERIGNKVALKSIQIKLSIDPIRLVTFTDTARILLVFDSNANGATPTYSSIIQSKSATNVNVTDIDSFKNMDNTNRYRILMDEQFYLPQTNNTGGFPNIQGMNPQWQINKFIKLGGRQTQYTDTVASIASIGTGSLFLITTSAAAAGTEGYNMVGHVRLRYWDIY